MRLVLTKPWWSLNTDQHALLKNYTIQNDNNMNCFHLHLYLIFMTISDFFSNEGLWKTKCTTILHRSLQNWSSTFLLHVKPHPLRHLHKHRSLLLAYTIFFLQTVYGFENIVFSFFRLHQNLLLSHIVANSDLCLNVNLLFC